MGMGLVAMSIRLFDEAIVIFKKNLQYAWSSKNHEAELLIYDYLGECYYSQGNMKEAQYYHTRYIQSEIEGNDSAIKKISNEMLSDYYRFTHSLEKDNLTSLFIEYLNLPITDFQKVPPP
jgi:tetratricopeptide (TPR) repeat protein